jgi:hypothetical protein
MTDWKMRAEVLTYSRARGLFAGVTLNGAVISQDKGDTRSFYGHMIPFKRILTGEIEVPKDSQPFLSAVAKYNAAAEHSEAKSAQAQPEAKPAAPATTSATPSASAAPAASTASAASSTPASATNAPAPAQQPAATATSSTPQKPSPAVDPHR